ncbi:hypothetical protein [Gemmata sp.]|uniref:hypothetical protein n=1 Tax=Gemmata sp. TaxID=1914242 RepID=UPI003F72D5C4
MNASYFITQLAVTAIVLGAANWFVARAAVNTVPRQLLRHCEEGNPATDLFLGNSMMAAGLDETAFTTARPDRHGLNAGLGSTGPVEHYLIYDRLGRHRGATVYYGFFDGQLTEPAVGGWDDLVGNRAMAYYVSPGVAAGFYAPGNLLAAWRIRTLGWVPALVERQTIWAKVERVRRVLGEVGLPNKDVNRFGRVEDFALLEPTDDADFATSCRRVVQERQPLTPAIAAILGRAVENGSPVVIVEMPVTDEHRRRFYSNPEWAAYREYVADLIRTAGGEYLVASDWVGPEGFADHLHLNAVGARTFTRRIANLIPPKR